MGARTGVGWTDKTWNPWQGCHHCSPGCENCYMFAQKIRYGHDPDVVVRSKTFDAPLRWKGPARIFTCSWSDFFIAEADDWRPAAWNIIRRTPQTCAGEGDFCDGGPLHPGCVGVHAEAHVNPSDGGVAEDSDAGEGDE